MDKTKTAIPLLRPILGGTKNGERPQRYSYWRVGYAKTIPSQLDFWVAQAGEYHSEKCFLTNHFEHANYHQFYYQLKGEARMQVAKREYPIRPGDLLIIPQGSQFHYEATNGTRLHWFGVAGVCPLIRKEEGIKHIPLDHNPLIETPFILMRETLILSQAGSALRAVALFYELLSLIESLQSSQQDNVIYPDAVQVALSYMREHYHEPYLAAQIARICGITPPHLRFLFQKWVGESPQQSHTRYRIEAAKQLLMMHGVSVREVAAQVGYADPYYFSRVFMKVTGLRPSRYRSSLYTASDF